MKSLSIMLIIMMLLNKILGHKPMSLMFKFVDTSP